MTASSSFDPESLQKLLSNAFVVQESGMDTESLSAIVELQGSIATGELEMDGAMDRIAARARNVANATGIAIGLLKGDRLVYRAGSGCAAKYVGQHMMATLCVSAHNAASGEILRVENAQTDTRIEAAICRQFGAQSLLILPIYHDRAVAGVLDVLFNEAHAFHPREVRTYRLMAGLVEEAMSYAARPEQEITPASDLSTVRQSIGQTRPQIEKSLNDRGSVPRVATNRAIRQACGDSFAETVTAPVLKQSAWAASERTKHVPLYKRRWETAAAVAAVLVLACWITYTDRRPTSPVKASALQRLNPIEQQLPIVPTKRVLANSISKPPIALRLNEKGKKAVRAMPHRVPDRNSQVRYIGEDVTVRYFAPDPARQRVLGRNNQVRHISEDVTVRYFTPHPAVAPPPVGSTTQPVGR
jgi:hypothetical protein